MAKKTNKSKKSKKSKKTEAYDFELPGDGELEIVMLFDFEMHGDKNASATALQLVKWNGGEARYEKRGLYRKAKEAEESGVDIDEVPWKIGKLKGINEKDMGKILNAKSKE